MPLLRLQTRTDGAVPSPPAPTPLTRRHPFAFVQRVDDEPTTTSFVSVGRHSSTEGHREFKTVSGNGPEWVTFHLRACVATGRAHCAKSPRNLREPCRRRRFSFCGCEFRCRATSAGTRRFPTSAPSATPPIAPSCRRRPRLSQRPGQARDQLGRGKGLLPVCSGHVRF